MKYLILCITLFLTTTVQGQDQFTITMDGLESQSSPSQIDHLTRSQMYEKTLSWIEENEEVYKLSVQDKTENESIQLTSTKWNATHLGEKYYTAEYSVRLTFEDNSLRFEPTAIRLKLNSKYDMGWEAFDTTDTAMYFKKGKVIKKYKSYLEDLIAQLNAINIQLNSSLSGT